MNPSEKLGPYQIKEPLGEGGMAEVSRALAPRLDRGVAIKVLPEDFAADAGFSYDITAPERDLAPRTGYRGSKS